MQSQHDWERGDSFQWSSHGGKPSDARTLFTCRNCGQSFWHRYNIQPDIFKAMEESNVPHECPATYDDTHKSQIHGERDVHA